MNIDALAALAVLVMLIVLSTVTALRWPVLVNQLIRRMAERVPLLRSRPGLLPIAFGGILVGLAVTSSWWMVGLAAGTVAEGRSDLEGMESLGFLIMALLLVGVPVLALVSYVMARMLRLPGAWIVSLLGLVVTALLACALRTAGYGLLGWLPDPVEHVVIFVIAYTVAALVAARLTRPARPAQPTGPAQSPADPASTS